MYHFVRELRHSRYPEIKGLSIDLFREQIAYLKRHYNPISAYDLISAVEFGSELPPNPVLLTFDDGYIDHFTEVFPILDKEKLSGCFFPPARSVLESKVLDVNKIHFVLASVPDKTVLLDHIFTCLDKNRSLYDLESKEFYWGKYYIASRYDTPEVMFVKHMLQHALPENFRVILADELFRLFVSCDEKSFAIELYMNLEQIMHLQRNGMYIGSHGFNHCWLDKLPKDLQRNEVALSLDFLRMVGSDPNRWIMCYPYGAYDDSLLVILKEFNCSLGFTTRVDLARVDQENRLILPRLDTNDLPKDSNAEPNEWTERALAD